MYTCETKDSQRIRHKKKPANLMQALSNSLGSEVQGFWIVIGLIKHGFNRNKLVIKRY